MRHYLSLASVARVPSPDPLPRVFHSLLPTFLSCWLNSANSHFIHETFSDSPRPNDHNIHWLPHCTILYPSIKHQLSWVLVTFPMDTYSYLATPLRSRNYAYLRFYTRDPVSRSMLKFMNAQVHWLRMLKLLKCFLPISEIALTTKKCF